jgi:ubiquinone/menaquinone biosynthesis C-methylase UbiE
MRQVPTWHTYERLAAQERLEGVSASPTDTEEKQSPTPDEDKERAFFRSALEGRTQVLDLGCGAGGPLLALADCVGTIWGLDAAPSMLALARRNIAARGITNAALVRGLAEMLPFADAVFDGVVVSGTLESLSDPDAALAELSRVAVPGAVVANLEWDFRYFVPDGEPRIEYWLLLNREQLVLQARHYLVDPYGIRDERYVLDPDSDFAKALSDDEELQAEGRKATDLTPEHIPREALLDCFYDIEAHFDPDTLREAFERASFEVVRQHVAPSFGVPHIFSVFRKAG